MILFELTGTESHPVYQALQIENGARQYDFLRSIVVASLSAGKPFLSQHVIKALNFQAISCLHVSPGEYRPCSVFVGVSENHPDTFHPPAHYQVPALMDDLVNTVNRFWDKTDAVALATFVLWRLNYIHPFVNGNGRTARAIAYFVLCLHVGRLLPAAGDMILPQLLRRDRDQYIIAIKQADASLKGGALDLQPLHEIVERLLNEQLGVTPVAVPEPTTV